MIQFRLPVFENLCPGWEQVSHLSIKRTYKKGSHIFDLDAPVNGVFFIKEGVIEIILYTEHGPEKVLFQVHAGCIFGEVSCFASGASEEAVAVARSDCLLFFYPREVIEGTIASQYPRLLIEMIRSLALKIRMYTILMKDSLISNPFIRVCKMLVYLAAFKGIEPAASLKEIRFEPNMTQNDLARMLGIHRVTVTKAIARLKTQGVVERFSKTALVISNFTALCELADQDE
ncbi:MAG: Crp/Fnr family transcriptional regulator [Anaerolineaceae bacterium]